MKKTPSFIHEDIEKRYIDYIKQYCHQEDNELNHVQADIALKLMLISLGYKNIIEAYDAIEKWYA